MIDLTVWWDRLADAFQHPAFHAAVLAMLVGIALTEGLSHLLPAKTPVVGAEWLSRVLVAITVFVLGYRLHPTTIGVGWALFAGFLSPSVHHSLRSWAYDRWPAIKPKALQ